MSKKYLLGVFDDDYVITKAVKTIRDKGVYVDDVMTPFAVHGLDEALGLKESRLHTVGFLFGATGGTSMLLFMTWISTVNYPNIFGGKPFFALPSFIPITFEATVLFAAVGMVVAFFFRAGLSAIRPKPVLDPRITNDKFVMVFDTEGRSEEELKNIHQLLDDSGAIEVNEKEI